MAAPWIALMVALWLIVVVLALLVLGLIRRVSQLEFLRVSDGADALNAER